MSAPGPVDLHVHTWYSSDLHLLDHPDYNRYVYPATRQFPLQRT